MTTIKAQNINLHYGRRKILDGVELQLESGEITALIGPNGAGKSSTFRILSGLVRADHGQVFVDDRKLANFAGLRDYCSYLLESPDFYGYLSGRKNLQLLNGLTGAKAHVDELLERVGLSRDAHKKVQQYSRGMKQRLGIAQILADDRPFLILDEPFNGLDPEVKDQMLELLLDLKKAGKGIVLSTHLLADMETVADRFVLLNKGKVQLSGTMDVVNSNRQHVRMHFRELPPQLPSDFGQLGRVDNRLELNATIAETESLLLQLTAAGLVPFKIERSSILHDKYMEIANDATA
ncbi:ABC transporter ATP-binding protein [Mangrovibacterium diazotrophicum]|uniref:ABC-type multidrug transport system ATPase subunit n=1 Tax=Mangrovibacterium diazotrophicum TaxID=1261403 RepID=A0A419W424_9BACT|nr:ABC transporter ATP-binding protein [Mangrovibacterium diazotrophicum]RKD90204.1 ABC-type multidrug transport system ATPase subunit [Mangrovibacterium diazotrophicum]